jgi:UDP-N-acetylglucosamine 2-epimerase (non-hydrolysing)
MKVVTLFGTRPEMIKMWSTLKKLDESQSFDHIMVHTGQNFTPELKNFFFDDLNLREPDVQLNINTSSFSQEVSDVLIESEKIFKKYKPDALVILGDTYSGLSVLSAANQNIKIFHMEAGLRAWDKRMPEQRNRILIDHISDILLPFNKYHRENLIKEGIHPSKIIVSGNPTFEVMKFFSKQIEKSKILKKLNLTKKNYFLITLHRSENVDNVDNFNSMVNSINNLAKEFDDYDFIFPMHPRTQSKNISAFNKNIKIINPLGFYDFNNLLKNSKCVISDSGTAAEEGLFYKVPNITFRDATERYETIESGGTIVSGVNKNNLSECVKLALSNNFLIDYDFSENLEPSNIVVNSIISKITNYF